LRTTMGEEATQHILRHHDLHKNYALLSAQLEEIVRSQISGPV
jgi:hypothetical protein